VNCGEEAQGCCCCTVLLEREIYENVRGFTLQGVDDICKAERAMSERGAEILL